MKKTAATVLAAIGSLLLILCILFVSVWFVMNDDIFMERELQKLGNNTDMGMSLADQSKALKRLIEYMQGRVDDINVEVTVNGELVEMFNLEYEGQLIEQVHMEEVRQVWSQLSTYFMLCAIIALAFFALAAITAGKGFIVQWMRGYLGGLAFFAFVAIFVAAWAAVDFNAFWTMFHQILFPHSTTWMLPDESRMIQMLTSEFFSDVIVRIVAIGAAAIAALALISVVALLIIRRKRPVYEEIEIETDEDPFETIELGEPNLIIEHKKLNLPVHKWDEVERGAGEPLATGDEPKNDAEDEPTETEGRGAVDGEIAGDEPAEDEPAEDEAAGEEDELS